MVVVRSDSDEKSKDFKKENSQNPNRIFISSALDGPQVLDPGISS